MTDLTDVGVNMHSKQYAGIHDAIIKNAKDAGIKSIITITNSLKESDANIRYCKKYNDSPKLYCTLGVHPHAARELNDKNFKNIRKMIEANREHVVAVGECGLDYNRMFSPASVQRRWFEEQIKLAIELDLPLYFHERDAFDDFYEIVKKYDLKGKAIVHCFTGSKKALNAYLDLGFYIGITGWVCDDGRGKALQSIIPKIPLDRILLETDSPWLTPKSIKPKPKYNEPQNLPLVIQKVAGLMNVTPEELINNAANNRKNLFGF